MCMRVFIYILCEYLIGSSKVLCFRNIRIFLPRIQRTASNSKLSSQYILT